MSEKHESAKPELSPSEPEPATDAAAPEGRKVSRVLETAVRRIRDAEEKPRSTFGFSLRAGE